MGLFYAFHQQAQRSARHRRGDDGVTLIEVVVAFAVLMVAVIPLSYLFMTSLVNAGQSANQQTALSIAERWTETLSNVTPPVNPTTGAVVTDVASAPIGPAPSSSQGTIPSSLNNKALDTISSITVTTSATFQATSAASQTIQINTGTTSNPNYDPVTYSALTTSGSSTVFTCATNPCSSSTDTLSTGDAVSQASIVIPTETRGNTVYTLKASYSWATAQNSGAGTKPNLCTSGTPALLKLRVTVSWGPNADANNVQDSVMINYPPAGVQTLGFIALQMSGDTTGIDTQSPPAAWSSRVQAIPVAIVGQGTTLNVYPDSYGCVFAQVNPGNYTVTVGQPQNGIPAGTTYASPAFVANAAGAINGNHVNVLPSTEVNPTGTAVVAIGAVTRLQATLNGDYPGFDQGTNINLAYPSTTTVEDGVICPGAGQVTCISTGENASGAVATWMNGSSWSNAALPSGTPVTRITSVTCAGATACIGVGYGSGGAVILHASTGASPAVTADTLPTVSGLNALNASLTQVVCPQASQCVAVGTTSTGTPVVLSGTIGATTDTWVSDTLPANLTSLSSLVCPTSANGCVAIATTTTAGAPVVVSGPSGTGTWSTWTTPASGATSFTDTSLAQVNCTSALLTACMAIGTGKINGGASGPIVLSGLAGVGGLAGTVPWSADTLTATTVTSLNQVICPTSLKCLVVGVGTSGATTGALFLYGTPGGALSSEFPPGGVSSIVQVVCPSTTVYVCTAIGTAAGTPVIDTGTINPTVTATDTWVADTLPSNSPVTSLGQVVCPTTTSCLVMATGTASSNSPQGYLLVTANGTSWSLASLPSADNVLYFDDIDCTQGASATCSAVGATPTGAVILTSTGGPTGTWNDLTPTTTGSPTASAGYVTSGVPIEINVNGLQPNTYVNAVTWGASANVTSGLLVYPFAAGYGLAAADCQTEAQTYSLFSQAQTPTQPGGTTNVTVPMGLLAVSVAHLLTGLPYAGATLQLTAATSGCNADKYTLQAAGADGISRTEVPFGAYTIAINGSATPYGTVVVSGNSTTLTVGASTTTYTLPTPMPASA